jgi:hypothetical protein
MGLQNERGDVKSALLIRTSKSVAASHPSRKNNYAARVGHPKVEN